MGRKMIIFILGLSLAFAWASTLNAASYKPEYKLSLVVGPTNPLGRRGAQKFADLVRERTGREDQHQVLLCRTALCRHADQRIPHHPPGSR